MRIPQSSRGHWQRELFLSPIAGFVVLASVLTPGPESGVPSTGPAPRVAGSLPLTSEESAVLQRASQEFLRENYTGALKILESDMGAVPHPEVLNMKGAALTELGRRKEAAAMFEWALEADPNHFWARYNLAEIALLDGDLRGARKRFSAATATTPSESELLALKLLLIDLKLDDEASARRQLPEWPPRSVAGYAAYAALAANEGDDAKRGALLAEGRRLYPTQWDSFLRKTLEESGIRAD